MRIFRTLALASVLLLTGCTGTSQMLSNIVVSATTAAPTQAKTVAEATLATSLAEQTLQLYVDHGHPDVAVLRQLKILVPAVHNTLKRVQVANAADDNALAAAALGAFNESLAALHAYETLKGVPH